MNAKRNDGPREKFRKLAKIPYTDEFSPNEMRALSRGLVPKNDTDKWFVYFEKGILSFHRSATGQGVYRVRIKTNKNRSGVVKWARCTKEVMTIDKRYEAAILNFLVSNLLLGQDIPFPRHIKLEERKPGEYQAMLAGTEFEETIVDKRVLKRLYK